MTQSLICTNMLYRTWYICVVQVKYRRTYSHIHVLYIIMVQPESYLEAIHEQTCAIIMERYQSNLKLEADKEQNFGITHKTIWMRVH